MADDLADLEVDITEASPARVHTQAPISSEERESAGSTVV